MAIMPRGAHISGSSVGTKMLSTAKRFKKTLLFPAASTFKCEFIGAFFGMVVALSTCVKEERKSNHHLCTITK